MTHFLIKMSQLCIHTQPQVIFAQSSTKRKSIQRTSTCIWIKRKPWLKHHIHDEDHPKGTHHTRYHSSRGGYTVLPLFILIGMSLMIEPLFESIRSDDSIHPCLVDKSCDRLTRPFMFATECLGFTKRYQHDWFLWVVSIGLTRP